MRKLPELTLNERALSALVGEIPFKEVAIKDLPLYIVITTQVFAVDLPRKEFLSTDEFEEYLKQYAIEKFENPLKREKFIKKQLNNAMYLDDEIEGDYAWQFNKEVNFKNARLSGFGILKTQSKQFYMFQTNLGIDLSCQFAAYQALTYGKVAPKHLTRFTSGNDRKRLKQVIGGEVYRQVLEALRLGELAGEEDA